MVGAEPNPGGKEEAKEPCAAETRATENAPSTDEELSEGTTLCAAEAGVDAMLRA